MKSVTLIWLVALAVPAALAQKVNTDFDESVDFAKYKTFTLRGGRINAKHPSLDNSLVEKRIHNAIAAQLAARGLEQAAGRGDLSVGYLLGARDKTDIDVVPAGWRGRGRRRVVHHYAQGTLVIDMKDSGTNQLVWRAVCTDTASDPGKIDDRINKDVKKAFEKFPSKKK